MANINSTKPFLTPDWTEMDGRSKPFHQLATGSLPDRYSVTVLSSYDNTGGTQRSTRMNESIEPGVNRILKYFSKSPSGSFMSSGFAEDYYISPRPKAKMKVLISFPTVELEKLPEKELVQPQDKIPEHEIKLNTFNLKNELNTANRALIKYGQEVEKFYGKVYGYDYNRESSKLLGVMAALTELLRENNIIFSDADSDLLTLYATSDYEVIYSTYNRGSSPIVLSTGFDRFIDNPSIKHKRVVKILSNLNQIEKEVVGESNISWTQFFDKYIYNPPKFDFSLPRPASPTLSQKIEDEISKNNANPVKTQEQVHMFAGFVNLPENNKALVDFSEQASVFIGDSIVGNLDQLGNTIDDVSALFGDVLNATGLDQILKSALDCLDINTEFNLGGASEDLLNSINQLFLQVERGLPHNVPTLTLPTGQGVVNLLADIGMTIIKTVVGAVVGALISLIQELIKLLFQFCSECSIKTEDGYIKKYNKLNFGSQSGVSWGDFAQNLLGSGALWEGAGHALAGGVIGAFNNSDSTGNLESFSQEVLKNSVNNIEKIYSHEAQRIFDVFKSGQGTEPPTIYSGISEGKFTGTSQAQNSLALHFGSTLPELKKAGFNEDMTVEEVETIVRRKSPWSSEVFNEASKQLSQYLDAVLTAWTPGEIGNSMLGCGISPEAKEVSRNALPAFPSLDLALRGDNDEETDSNLGDMWSTIGKLVGQDQVLKAITQLAEDIPEELKCLSEIDDTSLRKRLLAEKDPTLNPEEIANQVAKAKERNFKKIKEISDLVGRDDLLQGKMPALYCTSSADGTIIPGILPLSHPTTVFAIKRSLDTTYDSLKMTFNTDANSWVPALSIKTVEPVEIPRTSVIAGGVFGSGERVWNPDFKRMVNEGMVSYGSVPEGAIVPRSRIPAEERSDPDDDGDPTEIKYNFFLSAFSNDWANPAGVGMWEEGQTTPTPEQEYEWEKANVKFSPRYNEGGRVIGVTRTGGRTWENSPPLRVFNNYPYGEDWQGNPVKPIDYTRKFGYSPIPVYDQKEGPPSFIPGIKETYENLCTDDQLFNISLGRNNTYSFFVPNTMLQNAGIDFRKIQDSIATYSGELVDKIKVDGVWDKINSSLQSIQNSKFNIQYVVPSFAGSVELPKDEYSMNFTVETPDFPSAGADALRTINLSGITDSFELKGYTKTVIEEQRLEVVREPSNTSTPVQPQLGYYYDFSNKVWETGGTLYRNNTKIRGAGIDGSGVNIPRPGETYGFETLNGGQQQDRFVQGLYDDNTYKNLFRDLFCSFTNQLAKSPYLQLEPDNTGNGGMLSVNLTPAKLLNYDPTCQKTLLDVDIIKEQILREHDLLKCANRNWRTEKDFSSNKESPYEIASRAGCALLTIRLYTIEYLLKFGHSFHYFAPSSIEEVDETSIYYVYNKIDQEIAARGIGTTYYYEFQKTIIELYNRNRPKTKHLNLAIDSSGSKYTNFRQALSSLIRYQLFSVAKRMSKDFFELRGEEDAGNPHSILIQEWLPTVEPAKIAGELRFANDDLTNKELQSFNTTTGVKTISMDELAATLPGGALTDNSIEQLTDPYVNNVRSYTIGKLFRDYFFPNKNLERFSGWSESEIRATAERLWPVHSYGSRPVRDATGKATWVNEPVMGGSARETNILSPSSRVTGDTTLNGSLSSPTGHQLSDAVKLTNVYALGVSVPEKTAMNTMTQMMYAAQLWTSNPNTHTPIRFESDASLHWGLEGEELRRVREWYQKANSFRLSLDLPSSATRDIEQFRQAARENARRQWITTKTNVRASAESKARMDGLTGLQVIQAGNAAEQQYAQNIPMDRYIDQAGSTAAANATTSNEHETIVSKSPFWSADSKTGEFNMFANSPSFGNTVFPPKSLVSKTRNFGPGSLLRWMTQKKLVTSASPDQVVRYHEGSFWPGGATTTYTPGYASFVGHGLTWSTRKLSQTSPLKKLPCDTNSIGQPFSGTPREKTILDYKENIDYQKVWMDPYSTATTPWMPENDNVLEVGMPDLPSSYLRRLQIDPRGLQETPIGQGRSLGGVHSAQGGSRPNHLLFYLLPQDHWIGFYNGAKRSKWYTNVETAIQNNIAGNTQYISLLDLHPDAVRRALIWEQGMYANFVKILSGEPLNGVPSDSWMPYQYTPAGREEPAEEIRFYTRLVIQYNTWIRDWEEVMENLEEGKSQRRCIQEKAQSIIDGGKLPRNELETPPMYDIENGNPVLEPYIRVVDYSGAEARELGILDNVAWAKNRPVSTKGVVNIDKWDEFVGDKFGSLFPKLKADLPIALEQIPKSPAEDCGDDLPSRQTRTREVERQIPRDSNPQLQDYFKEIHYGLRIMYLPKPSEFSQLLNPENIQSQFVEEEKAFWIKEASADGTKSRWLNPYPLVTVEQPILMSTTIEQAITPQVSSGEEEMENLVDSCSSNTPSTTEQSTIGYFRWLFKTNSEPVRFNSPRDKLQREIISTQEYKFLFKYCFPLDRMLSLLGIYSSTYLASLPDVQQVFEPSKEDLMSIFMRSLRSGDWENACKSGNIDLLEAVMNGLNIPWASLLQMALKWPMLVFKGYMEQADINIAISKNIQNAIKMMNSTIATIQTQANAVQQAGAAIGAGIEQLANVEADAENCGIGVNLPAPRKPPDALFDPIEENLLYVPETWMIGLALLPSTIFAPFLWGPPITIPTGLAYWALDDSHINWLNAFPDFPNDLWARKDKLLGEALSKQDCPPDFDMTNIFNNDEDD